MTYRDSHFGFHCNLLDHYAGLLLFGLKV